MPYSAADIVNLAFSTSPPCEWCGRPFGPLRRPVLFRSERAGVTTRVCGSCKHMLLEWEQAAPADCRTGMPET